MEGSDKSGRRLHASCLIRITDRKRKVGRVKRTMLKSAPVQSNSMMLPGFASPIRAACLALGPKFFTGDGSLIWRMMLGLLAPFGTLPLKTFAIDCDHAHCIPIPGSEFQANMYKVACGVVVT